MNCPLYLDTCEGCNKKWDDCCGWFFPSRPLREILTLDERINILEARLDKLDGSKTPKIEVKHVTVYEPRKNKDEKLPF